MTLVIFDVLFIPGTCLVQPGTLIASFQHYMTQFSELLSLGTLDEKNAPIIKSDK